MAVIYVVMHYNYSDTSCVGATTDRETAYAMAREHGNAVEEYEDSVGGPAEFYRAGWATWQVTMNVASGGAAKAEESVELPNGSVLVVAGRSNTEAKPERFVHVCWARDAEHAIKITNELRGKWKASGGWDTPGWTQGTNQYWHQRCWPKFAAVSGAVA